MTIVMASELLLFVLKKKLTIENLILLMINKYNRIATDVDVFLSQERHTINDMSEYFLDKVDDLYYSIESIYVRACM